MRGLRVFFIKASLFSFGVSFFPSHDSYFLLHLFIKSGEFHTYKSRCKILCQKDDGYYSLWSISSLNNP